MRFGTLCSGIEGAAVAFAGTPCQSFSRAGRRAGLAVEEWEHLQGFPEGYTAADRWGETVRRRALGNAFAVPVMRWLGQRLAAVDEISLATAA